MGFSYSSSFLPLPDAGSPPGGESPSEPQRTDQGQGTISLLFDEESQIISSSDTIIFKIEKYQTVGDHIGP